MNERDPESVQAAPRLLVDQPVAGSGESGELGPHVIDLERHVMQPRATALHEPTDGRVGRSCLEQLDAIGADAQRCRLDALLVQKLAMLEDRAEQPLVAPDRLVEVVNGDADVVDSSRADDGERYPVGSAPSARTTPTASEESESGVTPSNTLMRSSRPSVSCSSSAPASRSRATRCLPSSRSASP